MPALDLAVLARNVPLTDAEVALVRQRGADEPGSTVREQVERVLDERVGPSSRAQRRYLDLDAYQAGATTPETEPVPPALPHGAVLPEPEQPAPGTYTTAEVDALLLDAATEHAAASALQWDALAEALARAEVAEAALAEQTARAETAEAAAAEATSRAEQAEAALAAPQVEPDQPAGESAKKPKGGDKS